VTRGGGTSERTYRYLGGERIRGSVVVVRRVSATGRVRFERVAFERVVELLVREKIVSSRV